MYSWYCWWQNAVLIWVSAQCKALLRCSWYSCLFSHLFFIFQNQPISIHIQSALRRAAIGLTPKKPTKQSHQSAKSKTESNRTGAREKARASHRASSKNRRLKVIETSRGLRLHELDKDSTRYQSSSSQKPAVSNGSGLRRPGSAEKDADRIFAFLDVIQDEDVQKSVTTTKTKVRKEIYANEGLFVMEGSKRL